MGRTRPSLVMIGVMLVLAGLFALAQPAQADIRYKAYAVRLMQSLPASSKVRPDLEAYLTALANAERRRAGRKPLKHSKKLQKAARAQAAEMILGNFVGHHSRGGFDFGDRIRAYMPEFEDLRGENAARDRKGGTSAQAQARRLFGQWLKSGRHRRNLIRAEYRFVSSGAIQVGRHLYAVQIFWEPQSPRASINQLFID
ncbi:MAG: CAP domain-containing protein [Pseudomonadota bacterium]